MTRNRSTFFLLSLTLLLPLAASVVWSQNESRDAGAQSDSVFKYLGLFTEVLGLIRREYVDPVNSEQLLAGAVEGAVEALGPGAVWVPQVAAERYAAALRPERAETGLTLRRERGIPYVTSVLEGSPAARSGIGPGMILAEIDGRATRELPGWEFVTVLQGEPGERRQLLLLDRGKERRVELILERLTTPLPRLERQGEISILRLPALGRETLPSLRDLLMRLQEQDTPRLLIDLLGCSHGEPELGFQAAGLWVEGDLGSAISRNEVSRRFTSDQSAVWKGEMVVLVDSGTRGACEVLAGVLRSRAGAKLVGLKTFGWAGEQEFVPLPSGGKLHLTRAFYAPQGAKPLAEGIDPDVAVDDLAFGFGDRDRTLPELIREVGQRVLRGEPIPENLRS